MTSTDVISDLRILGSSDKAIASARYFKTGVGEYGEGDIFIGVPVPHIRTVSRKYALLPLIEVEKLLHSEIHECRLAALLIMVDQYAANPDEVFALYMGNLGCVNNWDLVDSSADYIVGPYVEDNPLRTLVPLALSKNVWERRIAMLSCFYYIRKGKAETALAIIEVLKSDSHDLIQKAVGWMLREIGKHCGVHVLLDWLTDNARYKVLPRTTLRYSIEHFDPELRRAFIQGGI
jgi:3-methyladenine DNA glycosylase AlkD